MRGEGLVLCGLSWSDGEGAMIVAHLRERPGIIMTLTTLTCAIPGSVLHVLPYLIITKHFGVLVFCFTDEKIEAHRG